MRPAGTDVTLGRAGQVAVAALAVAGAIVGMASPTQVWLLWFIPYAGVGAVLIIRRPRTSIGWILMGIGWGLAIVTADVHGTAAEFADATIDIPTALFAAAQGGSGTALFFLIAVLATVFPSGRLPSGSWGTLARVALVAGVVLVGAAYVMPVIAVSLAGYPASVPVRNPISILPDLAIWQVITKDTVIFPVVMLTIASAISLVVRARRAHGTERQQLRWIAASIAAAMSAVVSGLAIANLVPGSAESGLAWIPAIVALPALPVAVGIAVLRYRLYEIDRVISRTLGWVLVTSVLVAVYAGTVVGLQAVLSGITQRQTLAVAASTLVAFVLFQPVRRRVQSAVDRRFDRARYDGERTTTAFAERLRDQVDLASLSIDIAGVVDTALRPSNVAVWIRPSARGGTM